MDYAVYISTAHSTYTEASPKVTTVKLTKGLITGGFIYFPSGPAANLHLKVRRGVHQIIPANPGENYALDDCIVPLFPNIEIEEPPFNLDILTWNDSTSHDHALTISLFIDDMAEPGKKKSWFSKILHKE
jgi:hypothetical protein